MASVDKYCNPDAPPGFSSSLPSDLGPLPQVYRNPDAPPGLYRYESEVNNTKVYFPLLDFVIDLDVLINGDHNENLSEFIIQTSDEESELSEEEEVIIVKSESESPEANIVKEELPSTSTEQQLLDSKERIQIISCGSSSASSVHSQQQKSKSSRSPSPKKVKYEDEQKDVKDIKPEIGQPEHLFGLYFCDVCNIKLNSEPIYQSHIVGKRHLKAVKAKNVPETVMKTLPVREDRSRYPPPAQGVYRSKVKEKAMIQDIIEKKLKTPCPGLNKVTEIQGVTETTYYCDMCDIHCPANNISSHLAGFKHRMNCLKYFEPELYEKMKDKPKYNVDKIIISRLKIIEKTEGIGKMVVEKEFIGTSGSYPSESIRRSIYEPSTSTEQYATAYYDDIQPDKSKSGYYCKICESTMNSIESWETHIRGKRHLTNKKRAPGSMPSKSKYVKNPNARTTDLEERLRDIHEPIVGLDQIRVNQNVENNSEIYICMLCAASFTHIDIVEHLLCQKHRKKYLQHIQHSDLELLDGLNIQDKNADSLIIEICEKVEFESGRGRPDVFVSKSSFKH